MARPADAISIGADQRQRRLSAVAVLRRALPIAAGALLVLCVIQVAVRTLAGSTGPEAPAETAAMLKPQFSGMNANGRAYTLTGSRGVRDKENPNSILITAPVLTLRSEGGPTRTATAKAGTYNEAAHTMLLTGDVRMDNGDGARFAAERALIDTRTGAVSGQAGLRFEQGGTQIESGDYAVEEKGDRVIMKGGVRGRITPGN